MLTRSYSPTRPLEPFNETSRPRMATDTAGHWWVEDPPNHIRLPAVTAEEKAIAMWNTMLWRSRM